MSGGQKTSGGTSSPYHIHVTTNLDDREDWAHQYVMLVLGKYLSRDPSSISPSDRLIDLMVDSLDIVGIVLACEDEFGIDLPDHEIERVETVQNIIDEVRKRRK
jgi:acyl carrier protein